MHETIERVYSVDIVDDDHGGIALLIDLHTGSSHQGYIAAPTREVLQAVLYCFRATKLQDIVNKPIVVLRDEPYGYIRGLKSLPCDEPTLSTILA